MIGIEYLSLTATQASSQDKLKRSLDRIYENIIQLRQNIQLNKRKASELQ